MDGRDNLNGQQCTPGKAFERSNSSSDASTGNLRKTIVPIIGCSNAGEIEKKQKQMNTKFRALLNDHRKKHHFTDLTIVCEDSVLPVHKVILSSSSTYFQELFLMEKEDEPTDTVALQGIDQQVMEVLLEFIYTGRLLLSEISFDKVGSVFNSAIKLGIQGVSDLFVDSMSEILNRVTFRPMLRLADEMGNRKLIEMVFDFILTNLVALISSDELCELNRDHFLTVMDRALDRQCPAEMILQAALSWVRFSIQDRKDLVRPLLVNVRLDEISDDYARFILEDEEILREYPRLRDHLQMIANRATPDKKVDPHRDRGEPIGLSRVDGGSVRDSNCSDELSWIRSALAPHAAPPRGGSPPMTKRGKPVLVMIGRDEANRASVLFYNIKSDEWSNIEDLELSLEFKQGLAYCDDLIFFIGGEDLRGNKLTVCYVRDLLTKETKQLADLRIPRSNPRVICWRGTVHAVGGVGRYGNSLSHVERLDSLRSTTWRNIQPLREKRDDTAVTCQLESRVYVLGGGTKRCEFFQPASRTWHELPSLPGDFEEMNPFVAAASGCIYVFNYYKPQRLYQLGLGNAEWRAIATKGVCPEWVIKAAGWKNRIYALDRSLRFYICNVNEYAWSPGPKVPRAMPHPTLIDIIDSQESP